MDRSPRDDDRDENRPRRENRERGPFEGGERGNRAEREHELFDDGQLPRRPARYDQEDQYAPSRAKTMSVLGLFSLIGGIFSLLMSFIPCIGAFAIIGGAGGILMGVIGLLTANSSNHGKGVPTAGIIVNVMCVGISSLWILWMANLGNKAPVAEAESAEVIPISAAQLCREYNTNIVKADEDYTDKVLEVTGQVKLVSKERIGRITVELGNRDDTVDCDFGSSKKSELAGIDVGQTVTIRGQCKGVDRKSEYVVLQNCTIVKESPAGELPTNAIVKVEAKKLLGEYEEDESAANKTYKGKRIEITGEVSELIDDDKKEIIVQFRDDGNRYVECRFTPESAKTAGVVRIGQKLTLKGMCSGLQDDQYILVENAAVVK